jgi:hypothetical protein
MRIHLFTKALLTLLLTAPLFAQPQPNSNSANNSDPQADLQQMRQQIFTNMAAKGIDPQQFFQDIRDKMASGNFDPADIQKLMIDKGIMDQAMVDKMQTAMQSSTLSRIKDQLQATDAEWHIIQPKIQKVLLAQADTLPPGQSGGMRMFMGISTGSAAVSKATKDLRTALADPTTTPQTLDLRLHAWRDAHEKAKSDLATAQKDLVDVLTVRQEATLASMGLIP